MAKLLALHDNYEPVVSEEEDVTREEIQEEWDFLDAVIDTKVMDIAREFMVSKGLLSDDITVFKRFLHRMWFSLYPRSRRNAGSCAFEHVFLGEIKQGKINGFHNWLFFLTQEREGNVDYYGKTRLETFIHAFTILILSGFNYALSFGRKGAVVKSVFEWEGMVKPVSSIFLGISPELELALYTLCVLMKPDDNCTVSMNSKKFDIQTHVFKIRGKKYLGSAYPDL